MVAQPPTPIFKWKAALGAETYGLRVYKGSRLVVKKTGITKTSWKCSKRLPRGVWLTWKGATAPIWPTLCGLSGDDERPPGRLRARRLVVGGQWGSAARRAFYGVGQNSETCDTHPFLTWCS